MTALCYRERFREYDAPFAGLKVVDLSQGVAGPYAAMLLAHVYLNAEVYTGTPQYAQALAAAQADPRLGESQRELLIVAPDGNLIAFGHSIAEAAAGKAD